MTNSPNPHYISQNANGSSMTQPVDTVDFPHSGLIKALNQMAAGNVVVKTGTDFDINQTGGNLVVAAGKILRNGKYHEVATKTFADSSLTTTYDKGYHLLVVADGREGGETVNVLYLRPPTAANRVPEFKLGDTIVAMIEYSSGTSAGSRLIQYFTTNKESNSLSIAYANSNVYTQAMTVDADSDGDVTFENVVQDKDIIFKVNDGGTPTEVMRIDGSQSKVGIGTGDTISADLHIQSATGTDDNNPMVLIESTDTGAATGPELVLYRNSGTDAADNDSLGHIIFRGKDDAGTPADVTYAQFYVKADDVSAGSEDGELFIRTIMAGTERNRIECNATEVVVNNGSLDSDFRVETSGETHTVFVKGDNNRVGIGLDSPSGKLHVKTTDTNYAALFETTDDSASAAPDVALYRNSATPTNGDDLGHLIWRGVTTDDDPATGGAPSQSWTTLTRTNYADIFCEAQVATTGAESGKMHLRTKMAGTMKKRLSISATETIFNEDAQDADLRVESTGNQNMIRVDASTDKVGIGHAPSTIDATLDILTGGTFRNTRLLTVSVSASTTLTEAAHAGRYNICAGNITLPSTSTAGEHYAILNTTGGNITIGRNGNNINGAGSDFTLGTFKAATCIAIGSNNWMVVG
tara:strand:+ start:448 stop:2361 length:1914 start_codon:yes stop_codon:yes gene_type:complete